MPAMNLLARWTCCPLVLIGIACSPTDTPLPATTLSGTTGIESGDGDGDLTTSTTGDGDPATTTGDGDGDPTTSTGDGDGEPTTGDGDGDPGTAFTCPDGLEGQTPDLNGVSFQMVAAPPNDGYPENGAFQILEGPVWIDGTLYVSHIAGGGPPPKSRILALVNGSLEEFLSTAGSNGLAVDDEGAMLLARHSDGTISRLELDDPNTITPIVETYQGQRFNSPNDLVLSSTGNLYFSDPNWQAPNPNPQPGERAYYVLAGGEPTAFGNEVAKPNGMMLSLDETKLYVGGVGGLYEFTLEGDGTPGSGTYVQGVNGGVDGMAKDCAGNIYVTANGQVVVLSPSNQVLGMIGLPEVTNVAFGGPEGTTLYATTLQNPAVHAAELSIPGFPY